MSTLPQALGAVFRDTQGCIAERLNVGICQLRTLNELDCHLSGEMHNP